MNVCGHTDRERGRRTPHFDLLVANPTLDHCCSTSKASLGAIACGRFPLMGLCLPLCVEMQDVRGGGGECSDPEVLQQHPSSGWGVPSTHSEHLCSQWGLNQAIKHAWVCVGELVM